MEQKEVLTNCPLLVDDCPLGFTDVLNERVVNTDLSAVTIPLPSLR